MGEQDTLTKSYVQDTTVFADIFNMFLHDGKQVITPESLRELDTTAITIPYGADNITCQKLQRKF